MEMMKLIPTAKIIYGAVRGSVKNTAKKLI